MLRVGTGRRSMARAPGGLSLAGQIAAMFGSSEPGVWFDPSDFSTMFQDSAGTTPVTDVEQPVGRIVSKVNGHVATQATSASRPVLSARVNLLTKTQEFDDAAWTKGAVTVTSNATGAPDGTLTADKVVEDGAGGFHYVLQNVAYTATGHKVRIAAKAAERSFLIIGENSTGVARRTWFNLGTGTVGTTAAGHTATIEAAADGWYYCTITFTGTATTTWVTFNPASADNVGSYTGTAGSGIFIWGADLRLSADTSAGPAYQRVNTATDYDTAGFKHYLKFDGVDDSLATGSINFTSTDKVTVWAGVHKASDAAVGSLFEGAAGISPGIFAPANAATGNYSFRTYGSTAANTGTSSASFASPITSVLTAQLDNGAVAASDQVKGRINGVAQALSGLSATGAGNMPNQVFYIGRRGGSSLPFNGRLYSLIVRGAASNDAQIAAAERYVNGKTGAWA